MASSRTRATPAWRIPKTSAATVENGYDYVAAIVEIVDPHPGSERQPEVRRDQPRVSRIVIIGRDSELVRRGKRQREGECNRRDNKTRRTCSAHGYVSKRLPGYK